MMDADSDEWILSRRAGASNGRLAAADIVSFEDLLRMRKMRDRKI